MRRPAVLVAAVALVAPLVIGQVPASRAAIPVRHYLDADQFGTPGTDLVADVSARRGLVVAGGYVDGQLPGQTAAGATDAVVRAYSPRLRRLWTKQLGTPGEDGTAAIATDGELVVAGGWTDGDLGGPSGGASRSGWVKVFRAGGAEQWSRRFGKDVTGVAITRNGVYVGGRIGNDGLIRAYGRGGRLLWENRMTSSFTPNITHLAAADGRVFYSSRYQSIDELPRTYLGSLDAATGNGGWFTLHNTEGDAITALTATRDGVYVSSTGTHGVTAYRPSDGVDRWTTRDVQLPGEEVMRFASDIYRHGDEIFATYVGWDGAAALVAISPRGRVEWVRRIRRIEPTSVVQMERTVYVGGLTRAALDGTSAGGIDAVVARYGP